MFFVDIVRRSGLLRTQAEQALAELAAAGLVHSDNFAGLRALITPASKRRAFHSNRRRGIAGGEFDRAGRWTLVPPARGEGSAASGWLTTDYETLGHVARVLLRRYGVVFRKLLQREQGIPPWRELLYVYRRLEARGEIRGGRFVGGHAGDQFALPEAVAVLRRERNRPGEQWAGLGAADPLNLSGVILPGSRVPASGKTRLAFLNGRLVGRRNGRDTWLEETLDERQRRQAQQCLLGTRGEGDYLRRPRHRPAPRPRS